MPLVRNVPVQYGGIQGLREAIDKVREELQGMRYSMEKELLEQFFLNVAEDVAHKFVFGLEETSTALEVGTLGSFEGILVDEELAARRVVLTKSTEQRVVRYFQNE